MRIETGTNHNCNQSLEQQPNRCDSCIHSEEQDGSNCYECVKGMADNFEAQPKTGYISIDVNKLAKEVAEKVLDEITYEGKTIREWAEILVKQQPCEDCISRDSLNDAISELTYWHYEDGRLVVGGDGRSNTVYKVDDVTRLVHVLPSVTPQRPEGRWIEVLENRNEFGSTWHYECSECRAKSYKGFEPLERYCPNCGAKMEVEE